MIKKQDLGFIVMESHQKLGKKVYHQLQQHGLPVKLISLTCSRFLNGEGKVHLNESVREKDLYILTDIGNYSISYEMHGFTHHISPDEHYQDLKRVLSAVSGKARKITIIMPLLYQARQHKRRGRESLDCALALQKLERLGVDNIITFDCHDPNVANAIPNLSFENIYPTKTILREIKRQEDLQNVLVISPDMGATERARYYADLLKCNVGVFYKRRDLTHVVHGKNPILEHVYLGSDVKDKVCLITDDMIASGLSMIEVSENLRKRGAKKIIMIATFALFTEGLDTLKEAKEKGWFDALYITDLSYLPEELKRYPWTHVVDSSNDIATLVKLLYTRDSLHFMK